MLDLMTQLKEREDLYQAELKREQDVISRLKAELEQVKKNHKAEMEQVAAEVKEREEGQAQKHKELVDKAEEQAVSAQKELKELKGKAKAWMSELDKINSAMTRKFLQSSSSADMYHMPTFFLFLTYFPPFFQRTFLIPNLLPRLLSTRPEEKEPSPAPYPKVGKLRTIWLPFKLASSH